MKKTSILKVMFEFNMVATVVDDPQQHASANGTLSDTLEDHYLLQFCSPAIDPPALRDVLQLS